MPERDQSSDVRPWSLAWRLMGTHGTLFAVSMIGWVSFHALPLTTGLATRWVFDRLTQGRSLTVALVAVGLCEALRMAAFLGAALAWHSNWNILASVLRTNLLDWVVNRGGPSRTIRTPGEQVSRFRDDAEEFTWLIDTWLDVAGTGVFALIAIAVLARVDATMTLVALVPLSATVVTTRVLGARMKEYHRAARRSTALVTGFVGELFGAVQAIKVAGAEDRAVTQLRSLGEERKRTSIRDRLFVELSGAATQNSVHLCIALAMMLGASRLRSGSLTVGDLTLFFSYISGIAVFPRFIGHLLYRQRQTAVAAERMLRTLDAAPPETLVRSSPLHLVHEPPPLAPRARSTDDTLQRLDVERLTYVHPSSHRGVRGVSFAIEAGTFTVVTGPVGSGKTTLLRALLGLLPSQDGLVRWNGEVVDDPSHFLVPPHVAYTPQVPRLFSESIADNVLLGRDGDLDGAVRAAVLEADVAAMTHHAGTLIGPRGVRLSGGQVQRVAAARMFAQQADLLVLDDISSALDVHTEQILWERLLEAEGRPTCLVVSHRAIALRHADQVVVLDGGEIRAIGTHRQVRRELPAVTAGER